MIRPRHAATLVLLRRDIGGLHVLMGERHAGHAFVPNALVFPGGAVDGCDYRLKCPVALRPDCAEKLGVTPRGARPLALALAAIRETFEETGLRLAHPMPAPLPTRSPAWAAFADGGRTPAVDSLIFAARAITPPGLPRRFDTRFFAAPASALTDDPDDLSRASGELTDLRWIAVDDALASDAMAVTRRGLRHAIAHFEAWETGRTAPPIPFVRGTIRRRVHGWI